MTDETAEHRRRRSAARTTSTTRSRRGGPRRPPVRPDPRPDPPRPRRPAARGAGPRRRTAPPTRSAPTERRRILELSTRLRSCRSPSCPPTCPCPSASSASSSATSPTRGWSSSTPVRRRRPQPPPTSRSWRVFSMAFPRSDVAGGPDAPDAGCRWARPGPPAAPITVKIVVAGGFAVGKTTFIGSISDIEPLSTEAAMTEHCVGVDDAGGVSDRKTSTTVAMDFGRIALPGDLWLYLFGTPGPGPLPLHVGRPGHRRDRRGRAGRHRAARAVLRRGRLLRGPADPVRAGGQLLRRRGQARRSTTSGRPSPSGPRCRSSTPTRATGQATKQALITLVTLAMARMQ